MANVVASRWWSGHGNIALVQHIPLVTTPQCLWHSLEHNGIYALGHQSHVEDDDVASVP